MRRTESDGPRVSQGGGDASLRARLAEPGLTSCDPGTLWISPAGLRRACAISSASTASWTDDRPSPNRRCGLNASSTAAVHDHRSQVRTQVTSAVQRTFGTSGQKSRLTGVIGDSDARNAERRATTPARELPRDPRLGCRPVTTLRGRPLRGPPALRRFPAGGVRVRVVSCTRRGRRVPASKACYVSTEPH